MKAFIIALGLSLSTLANATPEFNECMDRVDHSAFKNSQWLNCIGEEQERLNAQLKKEFTNVYTYATDQERKDMTEGQKNFLLKREAICREQTKDDPEPVAKVNYGACWIEHTEKWINVIRSLEPSGKYRKPYSGRKSLAIPTILTSQDNRRII